MHIIVCIKQVPDTEELSKVRINSRTNTLVREGIKSIINPFDENAIEEALRIKERHGGKVTVLSMGPPQAEEALRRALAMGADKAILLSDRSFAGSDTLATSYTLAMGIRKIGEFDLVLLGKQAIDGDTAQVGPGLAEWLNLPQITYVRRIELSSSKIKAERSLEDSFEIVETNLPALLTVTKEINTPRYPSLRGLLKAKKEKITVWTSKDLALDKERIGLDGSPTQVVKIFTPESPKRGKILTGEIPEIADKLISEMKKRKII
ncbi:electron transfer flavoprotein subunit beta [Candidatus Aerophobetes bacterium]|uniref:Electron transfer flavoprotein subunit beta n=1 Tax=Aerophobetes bacterium TaxID=2030807 RepID=A0A497E5W8_UNCAE|nr:MAG: electron transfer flavoprotein subunit beta [Candidatus Aerophobetes bacterium]